MILNYFGISDITFENFIIEQKFKDLVNLFLRISIGSGNPSNSLINKDTLSCKAYILIPGDDIVEDTENSLLGAQRYPDKQIEIELLNDFLIPAAEMARTTTLGRITNSIEKDKMFEPNQLYFFINYHIDKIENLKQNLEKTQHLHHFKNNLKEELNNAIIELNNLYPKIYEDPKKSKIKLNLTKREVCLLFTELINNKLIAPNQSDDKSLASLLETHFMYQDKNSKEYKLIVNAYNQIQKNRNDISHKPNYGKLATLLCIKK